MALQTAIEIMRFVEIATLILASVLGSPNLCAGFVTNTNGRSVPSSSAVFDVSANNCGDAVERRKVFDNIFRTTIAAVTVATTLPITTTQPALALDFDAFESGEISKDTSSSAPKLNDDEALCKYGAPGKAMGEACARAKIQRKIPGGVDATGKVDRGDYLKCRYEYPIVGGEYVKTRVCKPSGEWAAS